MANKPNTMCNVDLNFEMYFKSVLKVLFRKALRRCFICQYWFVTIFIFRGDALFWFLMVLVISTNVMMVATTLAKIQSTKMVTIIAIATAARRCANCAT